MDITVTYTLNGHVGTDEYVDAYSRVSEEGILYVSANGTGTTLATYAPGVWQVATAD